MRRVVLLSCVALAIPFVAAAAPVYRCTDDTGRVEYRDMPCSGRSGHRVTIEPNVTREMDQSAMRAAGKAIADRMAARAAADDQARARPGRANAPVVVSQVPWWQQPGPPPDRDAVQGGIDQPPPEKPPVVGPQIGPRPTALPVAPARARPAPVQPVPPPVTPPPVMPAR